MKFSKRAGSGMRWLWHIFTLFVAYRFQCLQIVSCASVMSAWHWPSLFIVLICPDSVGTGICDSEPHDGNANGLWKMGHRWVSNSSGESRIKSSLCFGFSLHLLHGLPFSLPFCLLHAVAFARIWSVFSTMYLMRIQVVGEWALWTALQEATMWRWLFTTGGSTSEEITELNQQTFFKKSNFRSTYVLGSSSSTFCPSFFSFTSEPTLYLLPSHPLLAAVKP